MNDFGMRSLSEDSGSNLNHVHVESLCETISDFLDTLDGSEFTNEELVQKRLSESEISILECGLIVADIKNISEDIDASFIPTLDKDRSDLVQLVNNLERINDQVLPALEKDLEAIQKLTDSLEKRFNSYSRDKSLGWVKKFLPTGALKSRDEHVSYAHQVTSCNLHTVESLLVHFDTPAMSRVAKEVDSVSSTGKSSDYDIL